MLLNILASEMQKYHEVDPTADTVDTLFGACTQTMNKVKGAYSIITLVNQVPPRRPVPVAPRRAGCAIDRGRHRPPPATATPTAL